MNSEIFIGIDLGGTSIKAGAVRGREVLARREVATPQRYENLVQTFARLVEDLCRDHQPAGVGLGIPGAVGTSGVVMDAPNLPFLDQQRPGEDLRQRVGLDVILENDANVAALGEARFGAGREHPDFLLATIGTGIGGGIILGGRLFRGPGGLAGEFGHLSVHCDRSCTCGALGCVEACASANGMMAMARDAGLAVPDLPSLAARARIGHEDALKVFRKAGALLGEAFAQVALLLDLRVFLVGGGGAPVLDLLSRHALRVLSVRSFGRSASDFLLQRAELGNDAGLIGAAVLAAEARLPSKSSSVPG